jgi:hypothetical protein
MRARLNPATFAGRKAALRQDCRQPTAARPDPNNSARNALSVRTVAPPCPRPGRHSRKDAAIPVYHQHAGTGPGLIKKGEGDG